MAKAVMAGMDSRDTMILALMQAFRAMVVVTPQGRPCYKTENGLPQGMPWRVERVVRHTLKVLEGKR